MSTTVQLNVRMDRALRDAGNAALESKGLSPSLFVRAIWECLAQRGQALEDLISALSLSSDDDGGSAALDMGPIDRGQCLYRSFLCDANLKDSNRTDVFADQTYDEMREHALMERWYEKGFHDE